MRTATKRIRRYMQKKDIVYLIGRLEQIKSFVDAGEKHMAAAKLLADISALKAIISSR